MVHHFKNTVFTGKPLNEATAAMIFVHGRGASAESILTLADHLEVADFALVAPNATGGTWYPYSFMASDADNQPGLSSALQLLADVVAYLTQAGIGLEKIYFTGFSQGACLAAEFLCRNAAHYGGAFLFTGGVTGPQVQRERYSGDFAGTPVFIGAGNPDFHVPVERVYATANILRELGATVTEKIYPGIPHTIVPDEIEQANLLLRGK